MCKYIACSNLKDVIVYTKGMQQQEFFVQYACMLSTEDVILLSPCIDGIFNFPSVCRSMCPKIFFGYFLRYGLESNFTICRVLMYININFVILTYDQFINLLKEIFRYKQTNITSDY